MRAIARGAAPSGCCRCSAHGPPPSACAFTTRSMLPPGSRSLARAFSLSIARTLKPGRTPMRYLLPLSDRRAEDIGLSGGKAASLARLIRAKLSVPEGFVVTTAAYRDFVGDLDFAAFGENGA